MPCSFILHEFLSLENSHSIMLNTIIHLHNFQDGRKIQNGRQIEDCGHIYIHIVRQLSKIMGDMPAKSTKLFHMLSITIAFILGGEPRHQEGRRRSSWVSKMAVMCNLKVPRSRLVSHIEGRSRCQNDPGRGTT